MNIRKDILLSVLNFSLNMPVFNNLMFFISTDASPEVTPYSHTSS